MEVELYVYDLSQGLARQVSRQFLGIQIDAIYHTSIVFNGIEYFFGRGVQTSQAGRTHHGRPMQATPLGKTSLPQDVIMEYLDSLKQIYTAESYDLFMHNCNNFSHDFAMFLTGAGIPEHITSLPKTVLDTPFGQMLRPQIDAAMRPVTQAPVAPSSGTSNGHLNGSSLDESAVVKTITSLQKLDEVLAAASNTCAVIFFTSSTCAPCKMAYPAYDQLASEAGTKCTLIKVDINHAQPIAMRYSIRATPTFKTFLRGKEEETWSGADPSRLLGTVRMLIQSAFPPHPHGKLNLPALQRASQDAIIYSKVPPMDKLVLKLGATGKDPIVSKVSQFIQLRKEKGSQEAPLPDLKAFAGLLIKSLDSVPVDALFAMYDLLRLILVDPRASGYFASEPNSRTLLPLLEHVNNVKDCPYNLRLVSLHAGCNMFTSVIGATAALSENLSRTLISLVTNGLLDKEHPNLRVAASSLAFNIANAEQQQLQALQLGQKVKAQLDENLQVELVASLLETLVEENNPDAIRGSVLTLGRLVYYAQPENEVQDLCRAMEASQTVLSKKTTARKEDQALLDQVGTELLGKGLNEG